MDRFALVRLVDRALLLQDAFGRREPPGRPHARRFHEPSERVIADPAGLLHAPSSRNGAGEMRDVPPPGRDDVERLLEPAGDREVDDADHPHQEGCGHEPGERQEPVVLEHRRDRGTILLVPSARAAVAVIGRSRRRPGDAHPRQRRHHHSVSGDPDPPAEVEIGMRTVEALVPYPDSLPRFSSDQHRCRRDAEDLEDSVELPLIDLARLQRGCGMAEAVRGSADIAQRTRIILVDDLGADGPDVLDADPDRGLHQPADGIPVERRRRLDDEDEVGALRHRTVERGANRSNGSERPLVPQDAPRAERAIEQLPRLLVGSVVDREDAEARVRLVRKREQAIAQPRGSPGPDHEQREHARCGRAGGGEGCGWRGHPGGRLRRGGSLAAGPSRVEMAG